MTYQQWMSEVNNILLTSVGLSVLDLADFSSRDLYESGVTPKEGACAALENDDIFDMFLEVDAEDFLDAML